VEALGSVVNFDVPHMPEDYIHRVGRTARAQLKGDAYTLLAPEEEKDFTTIERALGRRLPRRTLEGFDYRVAPATDRSMPAGRNPARRPESVDFGRDRPRRNKSLGSSSEDSRGRRMVEKNRTRLTFGARSKTAKLPWRDR